MIFVIPRLTAGGAERVISQLANYFVEKGIDSKLVILSKQAHFYDLHPELTVIEPPFLLKDMSRLVYQWRSFWWLRQTLAASKDETVLSFGGKYNAFVLLAALGMGKRVFVSDRSRPSISYGRFLDKLNPWVYRLATGVVAQTQKAKDWAEQKSQHRNCRVIANPIRLVDNAEIPKEPLVLNVGRFISTKQQSALLRYFAALNTADWRLCFLGDGPEFIPCQKISENLGIGSKVDFPGSIKGIDIYYQRAAIFAFTSTSEGFPNALGEAMSAGCACIAYDCEAGPADLIEDGVNGFLIPLGNQELYKKRLQQLIEDADLREAFGRAATEKMKQFSTLAIAEKYIDFLLRSDEDRH